MLTAQLKAHSDFHFQANSLYSIELFLFKNVTLRISWTPMIDLTHLTIHSHSFQAISSILPFTCKEDHGYLKFSLVLLTSWWTPKKILSPHWIKSYLNLIIPAKHSYSDCYSINFAITDITQPLLQSQSTHSHWLYIPHALL